MVTTCCTLFKIQFDFNKTKFSSHISVQNSVSCVPLIAVLADSLDSTHNFKPNKPV